MDLADLHRRIQASPARHGCAQESAGQPARIGFEVVETEECAPALDAEALAHFALLEQCRIEPGPAPRPRFAQEARAIELVAGEIQRIPIDLIRADPELPRALAQGIHCESRAAPHALGFFAARHLGQLREGLVELVLDQ